MIEDLFSEASTALSSCLVLGSDYVISGRIEDLQR